MVEPHPLASGSSAMELIEGGDALKLHNVLIFDFIMDCHIYADSLHSLVKPDCGDGYLL